MGIWLRKPPSRASHGKLGFRVPRSKMAILTHQRCHKKKTHAINRFEQTSELLGTLRSPSNALCSYEQLFHLCLAVGAVLHRKRTERTPALQKGCKHLCVQLLARTPKEFNQSVLRLLKMEALTQGSGQAQCISMWLQKPLGGSMAFRRIFSKISPRSSETCSTSLWVEHWIFAPP